MNEFYLILGMFVITFGIRFLMFALAGKVQFPIWLGKALKFVPPTVLTAIIVPSVVMPHNYIDLSSTNIHLIAAIFSLIVAVTTKNLLKTISLGMIVFLLLKWLTL